MKMRVWVLATVMAAAAVSAARATTMVSLSMDQLTQASSDIVRARVVNQSSEWNASHTQIVTITTMGVSETLKGNAPSTIQIRQLGGRVGNMMVVIPGDITFRPQREYILFLEPARDATYNVVGMSQGAYPVYEDAVSHDARVILPRSQAGIQNAMGSGGYPPGSVPLYGFNKYVATLVNSRIQIPRGLAIPVSIASTESRGAGRLHVYGRTTAQLFPNAHLAIPAGTEVEGEAMRSGRSWMIHWDDVSVRGVHAAISAVSEESLGSLRGRSVMVKVR